MKIINIRHYLITILVFPFILILIIVLSYYERKIFLLIKNATSMYLVVMKIVLF